MTIHLPFLQTTIRPVYSKSTEPIDVVNISTLARFEPIESDIA